MGRNIIASLLLILPFKVLPQSSPLEGMPVDNQTYLYSSVDQNCIGGTANVIKSPKSLYVYDYDSCKGQFISRLFFKVVYRKTYYSVRGEDLSNAIELVEKISRLSIQDKNNMQAFAYSKSTFEDSVLAVQEGYKIIGDRKLMAERLRTVPFALLDYSVYDESSVTEGTGIRFHLFNSSNKTIKYLWFSVTGINPVGDKVSSKVLKGVGPLYSFDSGTYEFKYTWLTDVVETAKIDFIKVQYMDGSSKIIKNPKKFKL
jgi:hypothetical protein